MRKIPTLFLRNPEDRRFVIPQVDPACEWVLAGDGVPTRKYDGQTVLYDLTLAAPSGAIPQSEVAELQGWWSRRDIKPRRIAPSNFVPVQIDEVTGRRFGWEPADQSPFAAALLQAVHNLTDGPHPGTHELLGPKVNRDPERVGKHILVAHRDADVLDDVPRDFDGLAVWLYAHPYEGIVWHHPDGRMAKLKRKDMQARG